MKNSLRMQQFVNRVTEKAALFSGLEVGTHVKIEREGYMPLIIDRPQANIARVYHYYTQAGDQILDPEIVFLIAPDGKWYPYEIEHPQMMLLGRPVGGHQVAATIKWSDEADGFTFDKANYRAQAELATFANQWATNLRRQGFLDGRFVVRYY